MSDKEEVHNCLDCGEQCEINELIRGLCEDCYDDFQGDGVDTGLQRILDATPKKREEK